MRVSQYLESLPPSDIAVYRSTLDYRSISVKFSGAPRKHPYDREKIILISSPFSASTEFLEFRITDITHAEDLPSLVSESGESIRMASLWVRRGSFALRFLAFQVGDSPDGGDCPG